MRYLPGCLNIKLDPAGYYRYILAALSASFPQKVTSNFQEIMKASNSKLHYQLSIDAISKHTFNVEIHIDSADFDELNLTLPCWIPGSYMVRDFAKNLLTISACNEQNQALPVTQLDKQSWQVSQCQAKTIIRYQVYAFDLSIRAAFLDTEYGFANGTSVFLKVQELHEQASTVAILADNLLPNWRTFTAMTQLDVNDTGIGLYRVSDYADLIEHPILFADADVLEFEVEGINFKMVLAGGHNADLPRIKSDLEKICQHHLNLFSSDIDIKHYLFMTLLSESDFGGLEHTHSTALLFSRNELPTVAEQHTMTDGYRSFLGLCSHELFHTWHVKRIKPKVYLTPDLSKECYSEQLWIYEGFTSYYDDFSLLRSQIINQESYLELLGQTLTRLYRTEGRKVQTVTQSSFEAWTKFYKQDENAVNGIVSYYIKGAVIALCLDLLIKRESQHKQSLDDVMQALWQDFGKPLSGTDNQVIHELLRDKLHLDLSEFLDKALYSTDELPWQELLASFGITSHFRARNNLKDIGGKKGAYDSNAVDLGMHYSSDSSGITVQQVSNGRAAQHAGLQKGDRIVALNQWDLKGKTLETELAKYPLGSSVELTLFRRGRLLQVSLQIQAAEKDTIYLTIDDPVMARLWLGE